MRTPSIPLLSCLALGLLTAPLSAASSKKDTGKASPVTVVFEKSEDFTDVKDGMIGSDKGREIVLEDIQEYLKETAPRYLPEGTSLKVTFTDIDLAGEYEPWRRNPGTEVRVVKDIYAPRLDFTWQLLDASGKVLREGKERLRDSAFMMRVSISRTDPLHYEKDMLRDWLKENFSKKAR